MDEHDFTCEEDIDEEHLALNSQDFEVDELDDEQNEEELLLDEQEVEQEQLE